MADVRVLIEQMMRKPDRGLTTKVIEALTTNETSFFRDACCMDALRDEVLPKLIRIRKPARSLRIWSAASSTGQEIFSVLMMLHDHFPETRTWSIHAHASDLNAQMVSRVKQGVYSAHEVRRGLTEKQRDTHFESRDDHFHIHEHHRHRVQAKVLNLVKRWPPLPTFDLILIRNVLIYFDAPTRDDILLRMRGQLAEDGALIVGASEGRMLPAEAYEKVSNDGFHYFQPRPNGDRG